MKITAIHTLPVKPGWLFVKLETDEGITGIGECLGDRAFVNAAAVQSFTHYLIGQDPRRIVHHWQSMYRGAFWRGGPTLMAAISGLEMAMWDILGKSLGVPVWQLLGGAVRERIRVYPHLYGNSPETYAARAKELVGMGYTAMKFAPLSKSHVLEGIPAIEKAVARVQAVREAVGNSVDLMLDFHGMVGPALAITLEEALRPFGLLFIEEPVLPENVDALAQVAKHFKTPIATGERLFTKWSFREVLEKGAASILQPDPCVCGGIFEARHIGMMAETYYAGLAPHGPYGPVNLAACLHVAATTPNFLIQEAADTFRLGERHLKEPFKLSNGYIELPTKPGLGIELDEDYLKTQPLEPQTDAGRWFHEDDGSVADW
jgi:galactonate dehydratase